MRLFHITSKANAAAILKGGFRDVMRYHHAGQEWTGVWVSSKPFDWAYRQYLNDANTLFAIKIPRDIISEFEWVEEGETIRERLIPASLLNSYGPPAVEDGYRDNEIVPNPDSKAFMGDFDIGEFLGDP